MQRPVLEQSNFAATSSGYLYEEPTPPFWRRLLPFAIVLAVGGAACYGGLHVGKKMAGEVTQLDTVTADPQLTQRVTIGADNPDLMMPQPTFAPPKFVVVTQTKPMRRAQSAIKPTRLASQPKFDPFSDNTIPFRPAEDYAPGMEHEKQESIASEKETTEEEVQPVSETPDRTPVEQAPPENTSSVPVAEPGFN